MFAYDIVYAPTLVFLSFMLTWYAIHDMIFVNDELSDENDKLRKKTEFDEKTISSLKESAENCLKKQEKRSRLKEYKKYGIY